jgi:V8-like Glu-specific endopeptidase
MNRENKPMKHEDKKRLRDIMIKQASSAPPNVGPALYFRNLVTRSNLPQSVQRQRLTYTGVPIVDATELVEWASTQGTNPSDPHYTTLGSLLQPMLDADELDLEDRRTMAAIIVVYELYRDEALLNQLRQQYQIPTPATRVPGNTDIGPRFSWRGPADDVELQSWFQPDPPWLDVGFVKRGIAKAAAVCRIELQNRPGTGFLIAPNLVLTNYHVFKLLPDDELDKNAMEAVFRFGCVTAAEGNEESGMPVRAVRQSPVISSSPVNQFDYALVRLEAAVSNTEGIKPLSLNTHTPARGTGLNILHHPAGGPLTISLSSNGVSGVYEDAGLIQYVTKAVGGSSGSPCFNDKWEVVGIHHAERSRQFGSIREGILMAPIEKIIRKHL